MSKKLTEAKRRILLAVDNFSHHDDSVPGPIRGREWFGAQFRTAFDHLVLDGLIEPVTEYRLTLAGRAVLEHGGEKP